MSKLESLVPPQDALKAENDRLKAENDRLKAEIKRIKMLIMFRRDWVLKTMIEHNAAQFIAECNTLNTLLEAINTNTDTGKGGRMSKKCHYCGGNAELIGKNWDNEDVFRCKNCGKQGRDDRFSDRPTVFHRITASPEVLARSLCGVVRVGCFSGSYSMLTGRHYPDMEAAIAATVAKLQEVNND